MDGHDPAEDHWWYNDDYHGEAATVLAADARDNLLDMFGNSTYVRAFISFLLLGIGTWDCFSNVPYQYREL
jgi:hypothetical protein